MHIFYEGREIAFASPTHPPDRTQGPETTSPKRYDRKQGTLLENRYTHKPLYPQNLAYNAS